jgi:type IV secretory pathway VirB9-like protein
MKRTLMLIAIATLTVFGQKIETQTLDRNRVTRLGTTQDHLSVIELGEPVTQVAAGSSSFKIEWRENKVFIQPLEPGATTNLFIWTACGRLSYELLPAASVEQMHFAIDQTPPTVQAKRPEPSNIRRSSNKPKDPSGQR